MTEFKKILMSQAMRAARFVFAGICVAVIAVSGVLAGCENAKTNEALSAETAVATGADIAEMNGSQAAEAADGEKNAGVSIDDTSVNRGSDALKESVVSSTWQEMNGYDWQDLYTILITVERTSQDLGENVPAFALVQIADSEDPILIIGNHPEGSGSGSYQILVTDEEEDRVYELLAYEGTLTWNDKSGAFCIAEVGETYRYVPHVLLESAASESEEGSAVSGSEEGSAVSGSDEGGVYAALTFTDLSDSSLIITSESIGSFVIPLGTAENGGVD